MLAIFVSMLLLVSLYGKDDGWWSSGCIFPVAGSVESVLLYCTPGYALISVQSDTDIVICYCYRARQCIPAETAKIKVTVTDNDGATATDTVQITVKNVPTKDATLALSIRPSKVKVNKSYTASGALNDIADNNKPLQRRTITIKTFDSSGNEITALTKTTTTNLDGVYQVTMKAPSTEAFAINAI